MENKYVVEERDVLDKLDKLSNDLLSISSVMKDNTKNKVGKFYKGWKRFVFKENIVNVAVGMIMAHSFKNTANSLVVDIMMPLILGFGVGANVEDLFIVLKDGNNINNKSYVTLLDAQNDGAVTLNYGKFINIFIDLIFVTVCLYVWLGIIYKVKLKLEMI